MINFQRNFPDSCVITSKSRFQIDWRGKEKRKKELKILD